MLVIKSLRNGGFSCNNYCEIVIINTLEPIRNFIIKNVSLLSFIQKFQLLYIPTYIEILSKYDIGTIKNASIPSLLITCVLLCCRASHAF